MRFYWECVGDHWLLSSMDFLNYIKLCHRPRIVNHADYKIGVTPHSQTGFFFPQHSWNSYISLNNKVRKRHTIKLHMESCSCNFVHTYLTKLIFILFRTSLSAAFYCTNILVCLPYSSILQRTQHGSHLGK